MNLPVSINISLGTNGHAHDASSAVSRWIDSVLAAPGRCVCVAAGNAGQEAAEFEGDRGFVMGRIHTEGEVPARDLTTDLEWIVAGNGIADVSENELEIWYGPQDRFAVSLLPPGPPDAGRWIGPVKPGEFIENMVLPERLPDSLGGSVVSIYNELYHPANGSNYISIYLSPFYAESGTVGIPAGTWTVRLHGEEVRDGKFHGWIERDDPRRAGRAQLQELWSFPSFFSQRSNVDRSSVSSLACGHWVISVANLDEKRGRINITSSQGPTRDSRFKPDVAAPGTDIVAAKGFAGADDLWVGMTGTSMASPYVAGVAGLMLAQNRKLTAAQILGIMQRTSRPLPGGRFAWMNDSGFGVIDANACVREATASTVHRDINAGASTGGASARRRTASRAGKLGGRQ
jgi:subtilisin family serine protease